MTPLRRALQIASVAGLVAFLFVRVETTEAADGTQSRRMTVGLPFSPWAVDERVEGAGKFRLHREVTFLSWSWLCLLPAFLFTYREAGTGIGNRRSDDEARAPETDVRNPR